MMEETLTLNTSAKIPKLALGTWQSDPGQVKTAVAHALKSGYKHIDCAFVYGNENEVGQGLKEAFDAGIKREDVFITTKLWPTYSRNPEKCLDESLQKLGLDYVDLYLVHWPVPMGEFARTLETGDFGADDQIKLRTATILFSQSIPTAREILIQSGRIGKHGSKWRDCQRLARRRPLECQITA